MSSIHKQPGKPYWFCAFYGPNGKRQFKSTGTANKAVATATCNAWSKAAKAARNNTLSIDRSRDILEAGMQEILESAGIGAHRRTIEEYFNDWLSLRENVTRESTFQRYEGIVKAWLVFLGAERKSSITSLTTETVERYRADLAERVSPSSTNTHLKVLRVALKKAVPRYFSTNPASHVENLDNSKRHQRRAFTLEELRKLLENASEDWKTMILLSLYTGLRMGDCVNLRWNNIDLTRLEIVVTTAKTERTNIIPISKALLRHLEQLKAGDDPRAPLCPSLVGKRSTWLSNQFFEIMADAGLVSSRADHSKKKKGRDVRRTLNPLSFHALRHTATSLLKNAGVSDVIARDIIGHESALISKNYTHIDSSAKREAIDKMPDILQ